MNLWKGVVMHNTTLGQLLSNLLETGDNVSAVVPLGSLSFLVVFHLHLYVVVIVEWFSPHFSYLEKHDGGCHVFHCDIDPGEFEFHHDVELALIPYLYPVNFGDRKGTSQLERSPSQLVSSHPNSQMPTPAKDTSTLEPISPEPISTIAFMFASLEMSSCSSMPTPPPNIIFHG
ncbi:hypothetical protein VNO80_01155 [Phaseolus coccineus]|uniref:Uncharacterized protein n=1 Tax=Phaseolus coccineus TaxID=3886 RepID=A0AAN9NZI2_PHACN